MGRKWICEKNAEVERWQELGATPRRCRPGGQLTHSLARFGWGMTHLGVQILRLKEVQKAIFGQWNGLRTAHRSCQRCGEAIRTLSGPGGTVFRGHDSFPRDALTHAEPRDVICQGGIWAVR